jgi:hypothetical protein
LKQLATGDIASDCLWEAAFTEALLMPKKDKCGFSEASNSLVPFTGKCNRLQQRCNLLQVRKAREKGSHTGLHAATPGTRTRIACWNGAQIRQHLCVAILIDKYRALAARC